MRTFIFNFFALLMPKAVHAADSRTGPGCGSDAFGPIAKFFCDEKIDANDIGNKLNSVISMIIGFLTVVAGLWFLIQFILAGISWISAGGDKTALEKSRNKLMHAILGLVIVVTAWIIIGLIGTLLGMNILNPGMVIKDLLL